MKLINNLLYLEALLLIVSCNQQVKKDFYQNGNLKSESSFINGKVEGVVKNYFVDGSLKSVGEWSDGEIHGKLTNYYPSGDIQSTSYWSNGVQEGETLIYYESGSLMSRSNFENGNREGKSEVFFDNGELKELKMYDAGKVIYLKSIDSLGNVVYDNVLPVVKLKNDTLQVNDQLELYISFGYELSGHLSIDIGKIDLENNFVVDTILSDSLVWKDFHYSVDVKDPGLNEIYFNVRHEPEIGDTLSADGVMKKITFYVIKSIGHVET